MSRLIEKSAVELAKLVRDKEISATELVTDTLKRIEEVEPKVHSFLTVTNEHALARASEFDNSRDSSAVGLLGGVPYVLKDNMCTTGILTTSGSKILSNFFPPYNATVVDRLNAAGAILVGKANCDEFAMGSSTENSGFGPSRNPWNIDCVPGGSSGGSASAVGALQSPLALGSDTGGSIRQPAALCGIVGMKPTYGLVSRYGLIAYASSLDQIGPMTRTVSDTALLLNVIAGHDTFDSTSVNQAIPDYLLACKSDVKGLRIGIPKEYFGDGVDPEVSKAVRDAIELLVSMGAVAEECSLPATDYALASYYIIAPAEASSNLARFDGVKYGHRSTELSGHVGLTEKTRSEGFGNEVKQRIMIGTYALSAGYYDAYYKRAQQARTLIRRDFEQAFAKFDVIITPTSPTIAFKIGEKSDDPLAMKLADALTIPVNMAGLPAISIPCGFSSGLPIGLQLIGNYFDEQTILRAAYTYEQATNHHQQFATL